MITEPYAYHPTPIIENENAYNVVNIKKYYDGAEKITSATIVKIIDTKPKRKLLCEYTNGIR